MTFTNPDKNIEQINIQQGDHIVIFGSGVGGHSFAAARALKGTGRVYAVDVREDILARLKNDALKQNITNITTIHANIESTGGTTIESNSKDIVIIPNTLFAYDDKPAILEKAYKILKNDGKLLIVEWRGSFGNMGPQQNDIVTQQQTTKLATNAGFTFTQNISTGTYHYGCLYKK